MKPAAMRSKKKLRLHPHKPDFTRRYENDQDRSHHRHRPGHRFGRVRDRVRRNLANRYAGFAGASVPSLQTRNVALTGQVAVKKIDREGASHNGQ